MLARAPVTSPRQKLQSAQQPCRGGWGADSGVTWPAEMARNTPEILCPAAYSVFECQMGQVGWNIIFVLLRMATLFSLRCCTGRLHTYTNTDIIVAFALTSGAANLAKDLSRSEHGPRSASIAVELSYSVSARPIDPLKAP